MVYINKKTFKAYYRLFACMNEDGHGCEAVIPYHLQSILSTAKSYKPALKIRNAEIDSDYHLVWRDEQCKKIELLIREFDSSFSSFSKTLVPNIAEKNIETLNKKIAAMLAMPISTEKEKNNNTLQW